MTRAPTRVRVPNGSAVEYSLVLENTEKPVSTINVKMFMKNRRERLLDRAALERDVQIPVASDVHGYPHSGISEETV